MKDTEWIYYPTRERETVVFFSWDTSFFGGGVQLATFPNAFFSSFLLDFDLTSFFIHIFFSYGMEHNYTQHVVFLYLFLFFVCIPFYFSLSVKRHFDDLRIPNCVTCKKLYKKLAVKSCWFFIQNGKNEWNICADIAKVEYWGTDYIFLWRGGDVFLVEWKDNDNVGSFWRLREGCKSYEE